MTDLDAPFTPDWVSPPGDTILDLIDERGWTLAALASRLGFSPKHVNQLVKGKVTLTEEAAQRLGQVLGPGAGFWLAREARYRQHIVRLESTIRHTAGSRGQGEFMLGAFSWSDKPLMVILGLPPHALI